MALLRTKPSPIHLPTPKPPLAGASRRVPIQCAFRERISGARKSLAATMAREVAVRTDVMWKRHEAMERTGELLIGELCRHLSMESGEVKAKWRGMEEREKRDLAGELVSELGEAWAPLSARSVVELVEELVDRGSVESYGPFAMLPRLKKLIALRR